jgi:hypothetical protein
VLLNDTHRGNVGGSRWLHHHYNGNHVGDGRMEQLVASLCVAQRKRDTHTKCQGWAIQYKAYKAWLDRYGFVEGDQRNRDEVMSTMCNKRSTTAEDLACNRFECMPTVADATCGLTGTRAGSVIVFTMM